MDPSTRRAQTTIDRWKGAGGLTRRAIIATISLWMTVIGALYVALEIVRSPAFVA